MTIVGWSSGACMATAPADLWHQRIYPACPHAVDGGSGAEGWAAEGLLNDSLPQRKWLFLGTGAEVWGMMLCTFTCSLGSGWQEGWWVQEPAETVQTTARSPAPLGACEDASLN